MCIPDLLPFIVSYSNVKYQGRIQRGAHPAPPPPIIFHTKSPKNVRASLRSAQFFKCAPLTLNPGSAPEYSCLPLLFIFINKQTVGRHVAPLGHIIMISANQSLLLLLFVFLRKPIHHVCFIQIKEQSR